MVVLSAMIHKQQDDNYIAPPSKVLASATTGIVEKITRSRADVDSIFGRVGIDTNDITNPINELNLVQYCSLFNLASEITGNNNFGLEFGNTFEPKQLGPLGYSAISSPTLSSALKNLVKYFSAHQTQTNFGLLHDSNILWLYYSIYDPRIVNRRQDAELSLGMFCNIFKSALGKNWSPLEVRFEHDRPDDYEQHEKCFGTTVRFGRRTNAIAFRREDLDVRMPEQDPYLFSIIQSFLESRCQSVENPEDFATIVRNQIKLHLGDDLPTINDIARIFGLSSNKFQKQLKAHGLTFPNLVSAARQELALHYMNDSDMPLTNIAYNLGYSELSAFSRAFRNWTGMSPQRYRRTGKAS